MRPFLVLLLSNGLAGGVLICVTALLRRLLGGRVPRGTWLVLWGVSLFRLLTPVAPTSGLSIYRLLPTAAPLASGIVTPLPSLHGVGVPQSPLAEGLPLVLLWAMVALALAFFFLTDWVRLSRSVRALPTVDPGDFRLTLLPRGTTLRVGLLHGAPFTFGLFRPTVVLPPQLEGEALAHVLAHESVHIRHRDSFWALALLPAICLHWYNPAVWLMAGLLKRDLELCCDAAVLKHLPGDRRAAYANTLIDLAAGGKLLPIWCAGFGRHPAKERIVHIMTFKRTGAISLLLAATVIASATTALATTPDASVSSASKFSVTVSGENVNSNTDPVTMMAPGDLTIQPSSDLALCTPEQFEADTKALKAELAQQVSAGEITQAEMDEILARQTELLAQLKSGEVVLHLGTTPTEDGTLISVAVLSDATATVNTGSEP